MKSIRPLNCLNLANTKPAIVPKIVAQVAVIAALVDEQHLLNPDQPEAVDIVSRDYLVEDVIVRLYLSLNA